MLPQLGKQYKCLTLAIKAPTCISQAYIHPLPSCVCTASSFARVGLLAVPASMFCLSHSTHPPVPSYKIISILQGPSQVSYLPWIRSPLQKAFSPEPHHSWFVPNWHSPSPVLVIISVHFSLPSGQGQCLVHLCTQAVADSPNPIKFVKLDC